MKLIGRLCETGISSEVTLEGDRIASVEPSAALENAPVWIAPGFLDLQINGYGGFDFNLGDRTALEGDDPVEVAARIVELAARAGTVLICPTICTQSEARMLEGLRRVRRACEEDREIARHPGGPCGRTVPLG